MTSSRVSSRGSRRERTCSWLSDRVPCRGRARVRTARSGARSGCRAARSRASCSSSAFSRESSPIIATLARRRGSAAASARRSLESTSRSWRSTAVLTLAPGCSPALRRDGAVHDARSPISRSALGASSGSSSPPIAVELLLEDLARPSTPRFRRDGPPARPRRCFWAAAHQRRRKRRQAAVVHGARLPWRGRRERPPDAYRRRH